MISRWMQLIKRFEYQVDSGTFVAGSSSTDSDVEVYLYDVTNAVLIQPSTYKLYSNSALSTTFSGSFQTASNSTSYRLIFHCASTSASAYTLKIDNVSVSPTQYVYGTPISDWSSYTPTFTGFGTVNPAICKYRRVASDYEIEGYVTLGTVAASLASFTLPNSASLDTTKLIAANTTSVAGQHVGNFFTNAATEFGSLVTATGTSSTLIYFGNLIASASNLVPSNGSAVASSSQILTFKLSVPILGLGASTQMSDSADSRVVAAIMSGTPAGTTGGNPIIFPTVNKDSHAAYSVSTGKYTAPVSGWYDVLTSVGVASGGANAGDFMIYVDGVKYGGSIGYINSSTWTVSGSGSVYANAGQLIDIRLSGTMATYAAGTCSLSISRKSGPSSIAATETIAASYYLSADQAVTANNPVKYDTKIYDTHGAYSTSTGQFTCPAAGIYNVSATGSTTTSVSGFYVKRGSTSLSYIFTNASTSPVGGSYDVKCNAGDTLQVNMDSTLSAKGTAAPYFSSISIKRVGMF
jgi:hypothetical protein